jgi:transposase
MKILALDLGKFKTVFVVYQTTGGKPQYGKIPTAPGAVHDLLVEHQPDRLVLEVGPAAGWVCDLAAVLELPTQVANTNDERWQWKRAKKKTDRMDALKLAQMSAMDCLPTVHVPTSRVRQWRCLIQYRHTLVVRRTAVKNSIRALFDRQGMAMSSGKAQWTEAGIGELYKTSRRLDRCGPEELWRGQLMMELKLLLAIQKQIDVAERKLTKLAECDGRVKLLQTAPCVGPRLSEAVVALLDDPSRFSSSRQVGAYVGLTPRQWQSGQSVRNGHISHWGNPLLRALLVEISWMGVRHKTWMLQVYEQVLRGSPKRKKIAIVAVARRLLVRLWAMMRKGQEWKETVTAELTTATSPA